MPKNPGPTAFVDMPKGSTAAFQAAVLGIEGVVEDFDLEVDLVFVDTFEPDLAEEALD